MFQETDVIVLDKDGNKTIQKYTGIEIPETSPVPNHPDGARMFKYITTFEMYDKYCVDMCKQLPDDSGWGRGKRPVIYVNWFNAAAFANWLSIQLGVPPVYIMVQHDNEPQAVWVWLNPERVYNKNNNGIGSVRLPRSNEWEACVRIPKPNNGDYQYAGSDKLEEVAWFADNSNNQTHPVGELKPTPYWNPDTKQFDWNMPGHYDLLGNTWEWMEVEGLPDMNPEDWSKHFPGKEYLQLSKEEWCPEINL